MVTEKSPLQTELDSNQQLMSLFKNVPDFYSTTKSNLILIQFLETTVKSDKTQNQPIT